MAAGHRSAASQPNALHLTFGYNFDQQLATGVLPASLALLTCGLWFSQVSQTAYAILDGRETLKA